MQQRPIRGCLNKIFGVDGCPKTPSIMVYVLANFTGPQRCSDMRGSSIRSGKEETLT